MPTAWRQLLAALFAAGALAALPTAGVELTEAASRKPNIQIRQSVYDRQPDVTARELDNFLLTLPAFRQFARGGHEEAHPVVRAGQADFQYSPAAASWLEAHGWQPRRFFCVMGRVAAALFIIEEGNDMRGNLPPDMPAVSAAELDLARRNLSALLRAGGEPAPITH